MADDPRDQYKPKHPTHPGMQAVTRRTPVGGYPIQNQRPISQPIMSEDPTPPPHDISAITERAYGEARQARSTTIDIQRRVGELEKSQTVQLGELSGLKVQVANLDGKVDTLVEESQYARKEREEREKRAETRAAEELRFRRDRSLKVLAIVVPTIAAIGAVVASIVAAMRDPQVKYVPAPPAYVAPAPADK